MSANIENLITGILSEVEQADALCVFNTLPEALKRKVNPGEIDKILTNMKNVECVGTKKLSIPRSEIKLGHNPYAGIIRRAKEYEESLKPDIKKDISLPKTTKIIDECVVFKRLNPAPDSINFIKETEKSIKEFQDIYKCKRKVLVCSDFFSTGENSFGAQLFKEGKRKDNTYFATSRIYSGNGCFPKEHDIKKINKKIKQQYEQKGIKYSSSIERFLRPCLNTELKEDNKYLSLTLDDKIKMIWLQNLFLNEVYFEGPKRKYPTKEIINDVRKIAEITENSNRIFKPYFREKTPHYPYDGY